jgi:hypothetical protein
MNETMLNDPTLTKQAEALLASMSAELKQYVLAGLLTETGRKQHDYQQVVAPPYCPEREERIKTFLANPDKTFDPYELIEEITNSGRG